MNMTIDHTHDRALVSWVTGANGHADFPVQNLPYGIFSPAGQTPRAGVAIGDKILDLHLAAQAGLLPEPAAAALTGHTLNPLLCLSQAERGALRHRLSALLTDDAQRGQVEPWLHDISACDLHLPVAIGDYTDFFVGIHHAINVGQLFRPDAPLQPNYKYVPIAYHGRASSVRVSGDPVIRPKGQIKSPDAEAPRFAPTERLDYELELGVWIGSGTELGETIAIADAPRHIAGLSLFNDWSARDIQAWEYVPLGPFLAKNFHSTISPWIVTTEALAPFRMAQPPRAPTDPRPLDYLWDEADQAHGALAIDLEISLQTAQMREAGLPPHPLSRGPASNMYWTIAQMVTHHTSNGCDLNSGDLLGTGTISAPTREGFGSLIELTRGGAEPLALPNGEIRRFLQDGDEVVIRGSAQAEGHVSIGFGECRARVLPARETKTVSSSAAKRPEHSGA